MKKALVGIGLGWALAAAASAGSLTNRAFDAYFLGFETDPAMDYGGASIVSVHSLLCRGVSRFVPISYAAPAYEFFFAGGLSTVQHEMFGHGSRGREFSLDPEYAFGIDFSGGTGLDKDPETTEQLLAIAAGGTESDSILAHRVLRDLYAGDGTDASKIPLMAIAKLDFSLYCLITHDPGDSREDFVDDYTNGNDVAYWLISRQAQRRGGDPAAVWDNEYVVDFDDPLLRDNYDDVRAAAIWNLVDPAALAAMYGYFADHVYRGRTQVRPPVVPLGGDFGLTVGTRAFMGLEEVTRFLDVYLVTPGPLVNLYVRDLDSSLDRTYGAGGGLHRIPLGPRAALSLQADFWQEPDSAEGLYDGNGWNAGGEVSFMVGEYVGLVGKVGGKSEGFFPGTPLADGVYGGAGLLVTF